MLRLKPLFFAMMLVQVMMFVIIINSDLTKYIKKRKKLTKSRHRLWTCGQVVEVIVKVMKK